MVDAALVFDWLYSDPYATQAMGKLILKLPFGKQGIMLVIHILILLLTLGRFIRGANHGDRIF